MKSYTLDEVKDELLGHLGTPTRNEYETELMKDKNFEIETELALTVQHQIEEILLEADRWGLRGEVEMFAERMISDDPTIDVIEAYHNAFNEWVK